MFLNFESWTFTVLDRFLTDVFVYVLVCDRFEYVCSDPDPTVLSQTLF